MGSKCGRFGVVVVKVYKAATAGHQYEGYCGVRSRKERTTPVLVVRAFVGASLIRIKG